MDCNKRGDWYDGGILIDLHKHNFLANNGIINNTWNQDYGGINAVNDALGSADADGTKQLRTVRAFFYYRLLDLYGRVKLLLLQVLMHLSLHVQMYLPLLSLNY